MKISFKKHKNVGFLRHSYRKTLVWIDILKFREKKISMIKQVNFHKTNRAKKTAKNRQLKHSFDSRCGLQNQSSCSNKNKKKVYTKMQQYHILAICIPWTIAILTAFSTSLQKWNSTTIFRIALAVLSTSTTIRTRRFCLYYK